jgi:hypothetical protein
MTETIDGERGYPSENARVGASGHTMDRPIAILEGGVYEYSFYHFHYHDWLIVYDFTSRSRFFHLYGDVTITDEGLLQNLGLYTRRSGPLSREGPLSCHTCCDTGARFFWSHPKDRPFQSPLTTQKGMWRIYSYPDPHGPLSWYIHSLFSSFDDYKYMECLY